LVAHAEMKEYAEAIRRRDEKFKMTDVSELIVDNRLLIHKIDDILHQKHNFEDGSRLNEIFYRKKSLANKTYEGEGSMSMTGISESQLF